MPDIPKPTPYREAVETITPVTHKSWPGSAEKTDNKGGGGKSK
jgi:hypothetical protein